MIKSQLPTDVLVQIQEHLRTSSIKGERGWEAGDDEEDTLTGDYLGQLRTDDWKVTSSREVTWKWKIKYKKFGSKAKGAPEKHLGADGIIQIELYDLTNRMTYYKGLLFQAKKLEAKSARKQAEDMESFAPSGSAVFVYGPRAYRGISSPILLAETDPIVIEKSSIRLGDFLADEFMPCSIGLQGLHYDHATRSLIVPSSTAGVVRVKRTIKHRLQILVRANVVLPQLGV